MSIPTEHRVQTGVRWLDQHYPGWIGEINLDHLDMGDGRHCVLGQVYGDYFDAREELGLSHKDAAMLGFSEDWDHGPLNYDTLTDQWRQVISERQHKAEPTEEEIEARAEQIHHEQCWATNCNLGVDDAFRELAYIELFAEKADQDR